MKINRAGQAEIYFSRSVKDRNPGPYYLNVNSVEVKLIHYRHEIQKQLNSMQEEEYQKIQH